MPDDDLPPEWGPVDWNRPEGDGSSAGPPPATDIDPEAEAALIHAQREEQVDL